MDRIRKNFGFGYMRLPMKGSSRFMVPRSF